MFSVCNVFSVHTLFVLLVSILLINGLGITIGICRFGQNMELRSYITLSTNQGEKQTPHYKQMLQSFWTF